MAPQHQESEKKDLTSKVTTDHLGETVKEFPNGRHVKLPSSEICHEGHRHSASLRLRLIHRLSISRQVLLPGVSHLVKSITAAKYILTTLTALSLTWTPWLVTMSYDIYNHHFYFQHQYGNNNKTLNYQVLQKSKKGKCVHPIISRFRNVFISKVSMSN